MHAVAAYLSARREPSDIPCYVHQAAGFHNGLDQVRKCLSWFYGITDGL